MGERDMNLGIQQIKTWMAFTNEQMQKNKQHLTKLDQAIGDGDHGINMARGFSEVISKINDLHYDTVSDLMKDIAMTIMSKVGGAAGPLYGTAFLTLSIAWKGEKILHLTSFASGLRKAVEGIKQRGGTAEGEKTLVDVWVAVTEYLEKVNEIETEKLRLVTRAAMEETKEMIGTKGRAAYFKENSLGHIDPGAMSSYYLFVSLCDVLEGT